MVITYGYVIIWTREKNNKRLRITSSVRKRMELINKKHIFSLIFTLTIFLSIVIAGCRSKPAPDLEPTPLPATDSDSVEPAVAESVSETIEDQKTDEVNECLECHTNQQTLMDTAAPVIVVESESSGEG